MSAIQTSFFLNIFLMVFLRKGDVCFVKAAVMAQHIHPGFHQCWWCFFPPFFSLSFQTLSSYSELIGQLGWVKQRDRTLVCFVLYFSWASCPCLCFYSLFCSTAVEKKLFLPAVRQEFVFGFFFFVCACFCWSLLSELKLPLHIQKSPLMCHFEARHSESVSLATERWFLHSGWPPRAAGCWQIAVGWQIRSCAPLICTVGPLALLCFVSQSLNSADDRRQPGTGWAIVVSCRFLESLSSCPKCVFTCNIWSCLFTKWSLLWFLSPCPSDSSNPYP